jgi:glycosyltransferase involved in cell wall biosynthesis
MLPRWARVTEDRIAALYSNGQVPRELEELECVVELRRGTGQLPLDRVIDMHLGVRRVAALDQPDVAFFPGNFVPLTLPRGLPAVLAVRSTLPFDYPVQIGLGRRILQRIATRYGVHRAARVITPSSATADALMRSVGARREKLLVVPHGVDLELFRPGTDEERDRSLLVFVSTPWDYKGLMTVLRALRRMLDGASGTLTPRLAVADGGLSHAEVRRWRERVERLGIGESVEFLGRLDHFRLSALYRRAAALVLPSSSESFGNPYLEAAASGCLVIGPSGHALDEMLGSAAIFAPAHSHQELAEAIKRVLAMADSERGDRSVALRMRAQRFSWDTTLALTREALKEAV